MLPAACDENGIVLNGDPNITLASKETIANDTLVWPVTVTLRGGFAFAPDLSGTAQVPSGTCQINLQLSATEGGACTVSGTLCGQSVNGSC